MHDRNSGGLYFAMAAASSSTTLCFNVFCGFITEAGTIYNRYELIIIIEKGSMSIINTEI